MITFKPKEIKVFKMKSIAINFIFVVLFLILLGFYPQSKYYNTKHYRNNEGKSFAQNYQNSDSTINKEMALFTLQQGKSPAPEYLKANLIEIPLQYCTANEVHLSLSKFNSSVSTFIHFYFKGESSARQLDSIFLVTHSHFHVKIPFTAYEGLTSNYVCAKSGSFKKETYSCPNFKAYYSKDKHRMYIYMIGGSEKEQYEVTWIFENDKFIKRVLTKIS